MPQPVMQFVRRLSASVWDPAQPTCWAERSLHLIGTETVRKGLNLKSSPSWACMPLSTSCSYPFLRGAVYSCFSKEHSSAYFLFPVHPLVVDLPSVIIRVVELGRPMGKSMFRFLLCLRGFKPVSLTSQGSALISKLFWMRTSGVPPMEAVLPCSKEIKIHWVLIVIVFI